MVFLHSVGYNLGHPSQFGIKLPSSGNNLYTTFESGLWRPVAQMGKILHMAAAAWLVKAFLMNGTKFAYYCWSAVCVCVCFFFQCYYRYHTASSFFFVPWYCLKRSTVFSVGSWKSVVRCFFASSAHRQLMGLLFHCECYESQQLIFKCWHTSGTS